MPSILAQLQSAEGEVTGPQLDVPTDITPEQLETLLNDLLSNDERLPYSFYVGEDEVLTSLQDVLPEDHSREVVLAIKYTPQAVFRVRPITRCTSSLPGHTQAILSVSFSPDGQSLASGSGDATVRIWDVDSELPRHVLKGHSGWVLCIAWSPNGKVLASGSMDHEIRLWDPVTGKSMGGILRGHAQYITSLAWEPLHSNPACNRLVSGSKDASVRIWDTARKQCLMVLTGHALSVTCVKWGGEGLIYTSSQDRTIKAWSAADGRCVRTLDGHGHWVNTMCLSTEHALRTGAFDHTGRTYDSPEEAQAVALERYNTLKGPGPERLISGSDDFTLCLWEPSANKRPVARMTGHQQLVNQVSYSPDGRTIASASFDKSVRLWDGQTGKFLATLRGHVGAVYQVCWSADSRMVVSGSKDSTVKVFDPRTKMLKYDLPGHADEVYAVDWSPDGQRVASGGKDMVLKLYVE